MHPVYCTPYLVPCTTYYAPRTSYLITCTRYHEHILGVPREVHATEFKSFMRMRFRSWYSSRAGGTYSTSLATVQYKQAYIYKAKLVSFLSESCVQQYFRHSLCPPDRPIKCATYHVPRISYLMPRALHLVLRTTYHAPRTSYITHHIPFIVKLTSPSSKPPSPVEFPW